MTPTYSQIPEEWKYPVGPYRQAPPEYGGQWWLTSPFTTAEPWKGQSLLDPNAGASGLITPPGFQEIFGAPPVAKDFKNYRDFQIARGSYLQDLKYFKQAGTPDWFAETDRDEMADRVFSAWEMGRPRYYEGRYGWMGRFPDSAIHDFEAPVYTIINGTHNLIATYQMRLLERGIVPSKRHPYVPPHLWPKQLDENIVPSVT